MSKARQPASSDVTLVAGPAEIRERVAEARRQGRSIGLVPTMGALHAGHISLVEAAAAQCDDVVVSIFVNPTQFGPHEDFDRYPRPLEADLKLLSTSGARLVFAPSVADMYPAGHETSIDVGSIASKLEGRIRPGHFAGVATVVLKLLNIIAPDVAFFGQKDYQQTLVLRRMVEDLDVPTRIEVCPTLRDADGLALSSRNVYLSADERRRALAIPKSLELAADLIARGEREAATIVAQMRKVLANAGIAEVDYASLVDPDTLNDVSTARGRVLVAIAARVGSTRLIDNILIG